MLHILSILIITIFAGCTAKKSPQQPEDVRYQSFVGESANFSSRYYNVSESGVLIADGSQVTIDIQQKSTELVLKINFTDKNKAWGVNYLNTFEIHGNALTDPLANNKQVGSIGADGLSIAVPDSDGITLIFTAQRKDAPNNLLKFSVSNHKYTKDTSITRWYSGYLKAF
jgi:hypothetical protein